MLIITPAPGCVQLSRLTDSSVWSELVSVTRALYKVIMASLVHNSAERDTSENSHSDHSTWQDYLPPHAYYHYQYVGNPLVAYMYQPGWQHSTSNTFIGQQDPSHPTRIDLTVNASPEKLQVNFI